MQCDDREMKNGLRIFNLAAALISCAPSQFTGRPDALRVSLSMVVEPTDLRGGSGFSDTPISGKSAVHSDSGRSRSHETTATQSFPGLQGPSGA